MQKANKCQIKREMDGKLRKMSDNIKKDSRLSWERWATKLREMDVQVRKIGGYGME